MKTHSKAKLLKGSFSKEILSVSDVAIATKNYINEHFRGISEVSIDIIDNSSIKISDDWLAYFFKNLLKFIDQESFTRICISIEDGDFSINISGTKGMCFSDEEAVTLLQIAKHAGFIIKIEESGILLKAIKESAKNSILSVYAKSSHDIEETFRRIFNSDL